VRNRRRFVPQLPRRFVLCGRSVPVTPLLGLILATSWSLSTSRDDRAPTCPDGLALARLISERLGKDPFVETTDQGGADRRTLSVRFVRDGEGHAALVWLREPSGKEVGKRELQSASADCRELSEAVALACAIVVDPMVLTRPVVSSKPDAGVGDDWNLPTLSQPPLATRPAPVVPLGENNVSSAPPQFVPPGIPTAGSAAAKEPSALLVGVGGGVSFGHAAPGVSGHGELQGSWNARQVTAGLRFSATGGSASIRSGLVRTVLVDASLFGCFRFFSLLGGCLTGGLGTFQASAEGLPNPRTLGALFASGGVGLMVDVPLAPFLRLRAAATGLIQSRMVVLVGGVSVFETAQFGATVSLSLHFKVWGELSP
jgi:hypothetical protein